MQIANNKTLREKNMPKKDERFTMEQRRNLALLHDDIDLFIEDFHTRHHDKIVLDLTPPTGENEKPKKLRCVYALSGLELSEGEDMYHLFLNRMMAITDNKVVRSVTNKLPNFYPTATRLSINSSNSFRAKITLFSEIQREINALTDYENRDEKHDLKREKLQSVEEFMVEHQMESIETRTRADRITYSAYGVDDELLKETGFFHGGVAVPKDCEIREPIKRKFRNDKVRKEDIISITEDFIFIKKRPSRDNG